MTNFVSGDAGKRSTGGSLEVFQTIYLEREADLMDIFLVVYCICSIMGNAFL